MLPPLHQDLGSKHPGPLRSPTLRHRRARDVSIVGYDDRLARLPHINLTTVAQDAILLAVEIAITSLDGARSADIELVILPRLIVRGTTPNPGHARQRTQGRRGDVPRLTEVGQASAGVFS